MPEYKTLRLDEVFVDPSIQPRVNGLDEEHVAEIEAAYRANEAVEPPVVWFLPDETHWLSQGYHRMAAMERAGLESPEAISKRPNLAHPSSAAHSANAPAPVGAQSQHGPGSYEPDGGGGDIPF